MDPQKLGRNLLIVGAVGVAISFFWWFNFYSDVVAFTRGSLKLSSTLDCLIMDSGACGMVKRFAALGGATAYEPALLWISLALLVAGFLVSQSSGGIFPSQSPQATSLSSGNPAVSEGGDLKPGDKVTHKTYGAGTVVSRDVGLMAVIEFESGRAYTVDVRDLVVSRSGGGVSPSQISQATSPSSGNPPVSEAGDLNPGDKVTHKTYGAGTVFSRQGSRMAVVEFESGRAYTVDVRDLDFRNI